MTLKYLVTDDAGNSGQYIPLTQGEARTLTVLLQKPDGSPFVIPEASYDEIIVKVYKGVSGSPIQKLLSTSAVTEITSEALGGLIGFRFALTAVETATIVANSSGIPVMATFSLNSVVMTELNFLEMLLVDVPVIPAS